MFSLFSGSLPVVTSGVQKLDGVSYFHCEAVATPQASITVYKVVDGKSVVTPSNRVALGADTGTRSYYCLANNVFGPSVGKAVAIEGECMCLR